MRPLSNDLRKRIVAAVDNHEGSRRQIARRFCADVSCITRSLQLRSQTGSMEPRPHGGGKPPAPDQRGLERLRRLVGKRPDATLRQLRTHLGTGGSIMVA
jgi:transposase